jgi:hypothetical protein
VVKSGHTIQLKEAIHNAGKMAARLGMSACVRVPTRIAIAIPEDDLDAHMTLKEVGGSHFAYLDSPEHMLPDQFPGLICGGSTSARGRVTIAPGEAEGLDGHVLVRNFSALHPGIYRLAVEWTVELDTRGRTEETRLAGECLFTVLPASK